VALVSFLPAITSSACFCYDTRCAGVGYYDMHGPEAVPLDFKMAPQLLKDAGWHTHAIGMSTHEPLIS
jgi:hypothetical protein